MSDDDSQDSRGIGLFPAIETVTPSVSKDSISDAHTRSTLKGSKSLQQHLKYSKSKKSARKAPEDGAEMSPVRNSLTLMRKHIVKDVMGTAPTVQVLTARAEEITRSVRVSMYVCVYVCI